MTTMNISLPEPLRTYVESQVQAGGYSSVSEYIRELIRVDQQRKADYQQRLLELREAIETAHDQLQRGQFKTYDAASLDQLANEVIAEGRRQLGERSRKAKP